MKRSFFFLFLLAVPAYGQNQPETESARVAGSVRDSLHHPVADAVVSLEATESAEKIIAKSGKQGDFHFDAVRPGSYVLRVTAAGYREEVDDALRLKPNESKSCSFVLSPLAAVSAKDAANAMQLSDETAFTVAAVTDTAEYGSHGSARFVHNRDTLSREAVSLGEESGGATPARAGVTTATAASLRALLAKNDSADLRVRLAEMEEREGQPLNAVRDYQRAAEMQQNEDHLFVWGAELLVHHAYEPAIVVFTKGRRLYPDSERMLLGLGAATYGNGGAEAAEKIFVEACDHEPANPTPYLFLGKLEALENIDVAVWLERMKRFVSAHPESAIAHYQYAVALGAQSEKSADVHAIESQLKTAINLDSRFGDACLRLGVLYADRQDFPHAISMLQKAVQLMPAPDQAHYQLAEVYRHNGELDKAHQEIELFKQITEQNDKAAERERREIPQFVYTLRSPSPAGPAPREAH